MRNNIILAFGFLFLVIGFVGWHNADNCHAHTTTNAIASACGYEIHEQNAFYSIDLETCYLQGVTMQIIGLTGLFGVLLLGVPNDTIHKKR